MDITINFKLLIDNNLTLSEYTYLKGLYERIDPSEMMNLIKCIDQLDLESLQARGFIKVIDDGIVIRHKTNQLFESGSLFLKFLSTFPIKTPKGRYLSPLGSSTVKADKVREKWVKLFKNKPHMEQRALDVLEAELQWRKDTNQLEYIHNIEAWLNQGDYENYEYLLNEHKDKKTFDDFM